MRNIAASIVIASLVLTGALPTLAANGKAKQTKRPSVSAVQKKTGALKAKPMPKKAVKKAVGKGTPAKQAVNTKTGIGPAGAPAGAVAKATVFKISSDSSTEFAVNELLRGEPFAAVGKTADVSGEIFLDWASPEKTRVGPIKVNAQSLKTDSSSRDFMIKKFILKAEDPGNEHIVFAPAAIVGLPKEFTIGQSMQLTITGDLTIAGVTKPATFSGSAVLESPTSLSATARAAVKRSDYNIVIPSVPFVASVDDEVKLSIALKASS